MSFSGSGMDDAHIDLDRRRPLLARTLGAVAVMAVAAVGATHYLATADLGGGTRREAMRRDLPDPETTGSIARAAGATRLDPCGVAARFPAQP